MLYPWNYFNENKQTNTKGNKKEKKPTFLPFLKGWLDEFWLVRYLIPRKDPK
jgi:hypothetical protein